MKKKLTREVEKQLKQLATALPPVKGADVPIRINVKGEQILAGGGKSKDKEGNAIKPGNKYSMTIPNASPMVNHHRRLVKAFQESGWDGVDKYIRSVKNGYSSLKFPAKTEDIKEDTTN